MMILLIMIIKMIVMILGMDSGFCCLLRKFVRQCGALISVHLNFDYDDKAANDDANVNDGTIVMMKWKTMENMGKVRHL